MANGKRSAKTSRRAAEIWRHLVTLQAIDGTLNDLVLQVGQSRELRSERLMSALGALAGLQTRELDALEGRLRALDKAIGYRESGVAA